MLYPDVPRKVGGGDSGHHPLGWVGGARRAPHVHPVCCAKGAVSPGCTVHQDGVTPASERRSYTILWVVCPGGGGGRGD